MTGPTTERPARVPLITGVEPRVGTSTLAAALHAEDGGLLGQEADIVVCGSTAESLRAAAAVICPGRGPRPVLAVVVGPATAPLPPALRPRFGAIIEIPYVPGWDGRAAPDQETAAVLAAAPDQLDPPLLSYAGALRAVVSALVDSGQLARGTPPMVIRPRPTRPRRDPRPADTATERRCPAGPDEHRPAGGRPEAGRHRKRGEIRIVDRPAGGFADQDDEAIEARTLAAEHQAGRAARRAARTGLRAERAESHPPAGPPRLRGAPTEEMR